MHKQISEHTEDARNKGNAHKDHPDILAVTLLAFRQKASQCDDVNSWCGRKYAYALELSLEAVVDANFGLAS